MDTVEVRKEAFGGWRSKGGGQRGCGARIMGLIFGRGCEPSWMHSLWVSLRMGEEDGDEVALGPVGAKTRELRSLAGEADAPGGASCTGDPSAQEQMRFLVPGEEQGLRQ